MYTFDFTNSTFFLNLKKKWTKFKVGPAHDRTNGTSSAGSDVGQYIDKSIYGKH